MRGEQKFARIIFTCLKKSRVYKVRSLWANFKFGEFQVFSSQKERDSKKSSLIIFKKGCPNKFKFFQAGEGGDRSLPTSPVSYSYGRK